MCATRELRARCVFIKVFPGGEKQEKKAQIRRTWPPSHLLKVQLEMTTKLKGVNSRSGSSQHLMPLRLGAHAERGGE